LVDVLALAEIPVPLLVLVSTVAVEVAVEAGASADVELTLDAADIDVLFAAASDDVEDAAEIVALVEGVSSEFPGEGVLPEPAPEDDPAVFDDDEVELDDDDPVVPWM
jgi:hypothetical protein